MGYPELRVDVVQAPLQSHPSLVKLGLLYVSTTCQVTLARSCIFLEDGTLTLSAFLDSLASSALLFAQKMVLLI
jgi:hypothetical protein